MATSPLESLRRTGNAIGVQLAIRPLQPSCSRGLSGTLALRLHRWRIVNIVVAGTGAYVLGRVLGMGALACATVGTVFELSGPMAAWLGYPFPAVLSWSGWIFAFGLLLLRRRHRAGFICALAVCIALLYGGAPEGFIPADAGVRCVLRGRVGVPEGGGWIRAHPHAGRRSCGRDACRRALAAPFALPGLQVVWIPFGVGPRLTARSRSTRSPTWRSRRSTACRSSITGGGRCPRLSRYFYTETAMYVGVCALVLSGIALISPSSTQVRGFAVVLFCALGWSSFLGWADWQGSFRWSEGPNGSGC